jgi:hypothetical protein
MPSFRPVRGRIGLNRVTKGTEGARAIRAANVEMQKIERRLSTIINKLQIVTPEALEYGVEPIFNKSQELVPVDTMALKNSGFIDSELRPEGARVVVGYAPNGQPSYAIFVHEMVDYHHEAPTQAKFLQTAFQMHLPEVAPRVRDYMKRVFDRITI